MRSRMPFSALRRQNVAQEFGLVESPAQSGCRVNFQFRLLPGMFVVAAIGMILVLRPVFMRAPVAVWVPVLMSVPIVVRSGVLRAIVARVWIATRVVTRLCCATAVRVLP